MDLRLYFRVLWRFRVLVLIGVVLAFALAFLSVFRVTFHSGVHVGYRQHRSWKADETLLVSQSGFPWGRTTLFTLSNGQTVQTAADPSRFSDLAVFYSHLANSDRVRALVARTGPLGGSFGYKVQPAVDTSTGTSSALPIFSIEGQGPSALAAVSITRRAANAFQTYIAEQQAAARIPATQRVTITPVSSARHATALKRKLTFPIVVFLAVIVATVVLAFILENLRRSKGLGDWQQELGEARIGSLAPYLAPTLPNGGQSLSRAHVPAIDARERLEAAVALALRAAVERALGTGTGGAAGVDGGSQGPDPFMPGSRSTSLQREATSPNE